MVKNKAVIVLLILAVILLVVGLLIASLTNDDSGILDLLSLSNGEATNQAAGSTDNSIFDKDIMITDGVKHIVELDEILSGGPPRDGIPSIDDPKFINVQEAGDFLEDDEIGIAISMDGVNRYYPYQILVWHEIVNDIVNGERVLVTYCPLCFSGAVFDPVVLGEQVEFGTSGKLWNSNLVMYDRKNENLWSQALGQAIVGEQSGTLLDLLPSDQLTFGKWKAQFPDGEVLSRNTGALKFYGQDPYSGYYEDNTAILFNVRANDDWLENKEYILGVVVDEQAKAYYPLAIKELGEVEDEFAGKTLVLKYDSDLDVVRIFEKLTDGTLERINPFGHFWFSWVAAHPDTELYK